jgi:hypothetical protein
MSTSGRLAKLEDAAQSAPCPACGRDAPAVRDLLAWATGVEAEAVDSVARAAAFRRACGKCLPNAPCTVHRVNAARAGASDDLRNCTTDELRTIRGILADARRRAGLPEKPS